MNTGTRMLLAGVLAAATACGGGQAASAPVTPMAAPGANAVPAMSPADRRAAPVPVGPTLYTRLGGSDAIRAVVDDFTDRVAADDRINAFFRGVDIPNFKRLLAEQICQATGGPCVYSGRSMVAAHTGLNLTDDHFNALVQDLVAALNHLNVPARERAELLGALGGMKGDIVGH